MSFSFRQTIPTTKASKSDNLFAGKSLLRAEEKKKEQNQAKGNSALQDYLAKKYANGDGGGSDGAAPKKKRKKKAADTGAIKIVDQDVSGFNAVDPSGRGALPRRGGRGLDDDEEEDDGACVYKWQRAGGGGRGKGGSQTRGHMVGAWRGGGEGAAHRLRG